MDSVILIVFEIDFEFELEQEFLLEQGFLLELVFLLEVEFLLRLEFLVEMCELQSQLDIIFILSFIEFGIMNFDDQ